MSENKEQTAVEWLEEQTRKPEWHSLKRGDIFKQAKAMEKEQIVKAYMNVNDEKDHKWIYDDMSKEFAEKYYTETYGK